MKQEDLVIVQQHVRGLRKTEEDVRASDAQREDCGRLATALENLMWWTTTETSTGPRSAMSTNLTLERIADLREYWYPTTHEVTALLSHAGALIRLSEWLYPDKRATLLHLPLSLYEVVVGEHAGPDITSACGVTLHEAILSALAKAEERL